jgi:hypothetical protein
MLQPILNDLAAYINLNTNNNFFRNSYAHVTLERREDREGNQITIPLAWDEDGINEGRPLFEEYLAPYFYLRVAGPAVSSEAAYSVDSCTKSITNTYPVRFVAHIGEEQGGEFGDRRAIVFQQLIGAFKYDIPSTSIIQKVIVSIDGYNANKYEVFEEEMDGVPINHITQRTNIIAIDLEIAVTYQPADCVEDSLFCSGDLLQSVQQITGCDCDITATFPSGLQSGYVRATELQDVEEVCTYDNGNGAVLRNTDSGGVHSNWSNGAAFGPAITPPFAIRWHHIGGGDYQIGFSENPAYALPKNAIPSTLLVSSGFDTFTNQGRLLHFITGVNVSSTNQWYYNHGVSEEMELRHLGGTDGAELYADGVLITNYFGVATNGNDCVPVLVFGTEGAMVYDLRVVQL